jgi:DNA-binding GntR family transcriptional regulator
VVDQATARLREAILAGRYGSGHRLVERALATELGISTIAVREVLARLVEDGLVERRPHRGAVVAAITPDGARDLMRVRAALEVLAAELCIANWSEQAHNQAQDLVDRMGVAASAGDALALHHLDTEFHELFCRVADSETLTSLVARLRIQVVRALRETMLSIPMDQLHGIAKLHQAWLDAVASRDAQAATAVVSAHIDGSCEALVRHLERAAPPEAVAATPTLRRSRKSR